MGLCTLDKEKEFLIWFAGFWEGEGCLSILPTKRNPNRYNFFFQISQSGERGELITKELMEKFGGHIEKHRKDPRYNSCKTLWTWRLNRYSEIISFATKIIPYLRVRKVEVEEKLQKMLAIKVWPRKAYHHWSKDDDEFLQRNLVLSDRALANIIGSTESGIKSYRIKMRFLKGNPRK